MSTQTRLLRDSRGQIRKGTGRLKSCKHCRARIEQGTMYTRQMYCSGKCRSAAFYQQLKEKAGIV